MRMRRSCTAGIVLLVLCGFVLPVSSSTDGIVAGGSTARNGPAAVSSSPVTSPVQVAQASRRGGSQAGVETWTSRQERVVSGGDEPTKIRIRGNAVLVPVTIVHGGREADVQLLLDTGASATTLHAAVAERLGADIVVVHPGRDVPSVRRDREVRWLAENLCRALDRMPDGIVLAVETMVSRTDAGVQADLRPALDRLPGDRCGVCIDTGHVRLGTDVVGCIEALSGRIVTVHLQDNHGKADDHLLPGSGSIDWPPVFDALRGAGYRGPWMAEGADPGLTPRQNAREFVRRMRRMAPAGSGTDKRRRAV